MLPRFGLRVSEPRRSHRGSNSENRRPELADTVEKVAKETV
jgi:hypothetical protein